MLAWKSTRTGALLCALLLCVVSAEAGSPPDVDRAEITRHRLETLAEELAATANQYGPDAVALQISLMTKTIEAGAVESTAVRVVGPSKRAGNEYLQIDVSTGLLFDEETSSAAQRFETVWTKMVRPALAALKRFEFRPGGLDLGVSYRTQAASRLANGRLDPGGAGSVRETRVLLSAATLAELAGGSLSAEQLLGHAAVAEESLLAPPPEPADSQP